MKLLLIIGFAAFVAAANAFKDPCICTREYMPVCGTDGVTYGNKCMLNCEKQTKNHDLEIAHVGPCDEHREEIEDAAQKHCICPFLWAPVCGTNGRTYPNDCVFKCHQDEDKDVKIAHPGVCKGFPNIQENEHKKPCVCTMEWRPVCGTDGRTYGNKCAFNCEKRDSNPDLEIAHEGPCDEHREEIEKSAQKPCICTMEWMPVCGTDGKTYGNKCELGCAVRNTNPELEIAHEGPCGEKQLEELKATPCICPYIWAPECGTDGRTYPNECVLKCENRGNNEVKVAHHGVCAGFPSEQEDEEDLQEMRDPCACDRVLHPVCGSDGKTYNNRCLLRCAKLTGNPELEQVHEGPCEQEELLKDPCVCTREYRPVCGTDGVTYPNPCELRCAAVDKPELKQLHNGPCEEETEAAEMRDPCICPKIYYPVCGSDGKTYSNPCTLRCAASTNPKLQLVHFGECKQETEEEFNELFRNPCVCNKMLRPVCGSDGRTYSNPCRLNCAKETRDHALTLVHYGACESKAYEQSLIPTTDVCKCPLMLLLVCGSDGKTYANPCELKCRQRLTNKNLQMVHMGPCREEAYEEAVLEKHPKPCACNRMLLPVCGSDGVTYANPCLLNCAKRSNPELEMVRYGPCIQNHFEEFEENEVCACNRMWYPVCGTDGKTYANPCLLKCAQKNGKPNLEVRHVGEC